MTLISASAASMAEPSQRSRCGPPWGRGPSSRGAGLSRRRTRRGEEGAEEQPSERVCAVRYAQHGELEFARHAQASRLSLPLPPSLPPSLPRLSDDAVRQRARGRVATGLEGEVKAVLGSRDAAIDVVAVDGQRPVPDGERRTRKGGLDGQPAASLLGAAEPSVKFAPPQLPWTNAQPVLKSFRFAAM